MHTHILCYEIVQDPSQMMPSLESETQTAGTGEIHRQAPQQLPLRAVAPDGPPQGQPDLKTISEPLRARSPNNSKPPHHQQPVTLPLSSPSTVSNIGLVAAPTVHSSQVRSPYTPPESQPKLPHSHPQGGHLPGQARPSLNQTSQTRQSHSAYAATSPGSIAYSQCYGGKQSLSGTLSSGDPYQIPSQRDNFSYNTKTQNYQSQQATHPLCGALYQPKDATGQPQHPSQAYQPHHVHGSQPQPPLPQKQPQPSPQLPTSETARLQDLKTQASPSISTKPLLQSDANTTVCHADDSESDQDLQFENPLQRQVDDDIHREASEVRQQVSGDQRHVVTNCQRPFDPNLVCPMCMKQFRIGEIQKFKHHVNTCDGTEDVSNI